MKVVEDACQDRQRQHRHETAGRPDGQGKPREGRGRHEPVFAYIASLPQPQRGVAERIDALAAKTLPDLQRAVKWGMAYDGVGGVGAVAERNHLADDPAPPCSPSGFVRRRGSFVRGETSVTTQGSLARSRLWRRVVSQAIAPM